MSAIFLFILVVCDMHLLGLGILSASIYYYILTSYAPFSIYFSIWLPIYCCAMLAGCVCLASAMYLATCMLLYYANRKPRRTKTSAEREASPSKERFVFMRTILLPPRSVSGWLYVNARSMSDWPLIMRSIPRSGCTPSTQALLSPSFF